MDDRVLDLIINNIQDVKQDMLNRFDDIERKLDNVVSKEDCQKNRKIIESQSQNKNKELSIKKISAIGTIVIGVLTTSGTLIYGIIKILN